MTKIIKFLAASALFFILASPAMAQERNPDPLNKFPDGFCGEENASFYNLMNEYGLKILATTSNTNELSGRFTTMYFNDRWYVFFHRTINSQKVVCILTRGTSRKALFGDPA